MSRQAPERAERLAFRARWLVLIWIAAFWVHYVWRYAAEIRTSALVERLLPWLH